MGQRNQQIQKVKEEKLVSFKTANKARAKDHTVKVEVQKEKDDKRLKHPRHPKTVSISENGMQYCTHGFTLVDVDGTVYHPLCCNPASSSLGKALDRLQSLVVDMQQTIKEVQACGRNEKATKKGK